MSAQSATPSIECTRVTRTDTRPGSEGTYIVRLSPANVQKLKVKNGSYLKVSYGKASVLACLSVDYELDDDSTVRIDQTLRTAIGLEAMMQGSGKKELIYRTNGDRDLEHPIFIQLSQFPGPTLLAKLVKQQYLICAAHVAMSEDMEKPIARLTPNSMETIGIQPGDKVLLISENGRKPVRCLALDSKKQLPTKTMNEYFPEGRGPLLEDEDLRLPWVTLDRQTRIAIGAEPWEPIIVGRDPRHALTSELGVVAMGLAVSALGGAIVVPDIHPLLPMAIVIAGFVGVSVLIWIKIRSRI
jgi:formylmethanofuran dehydrogenase subunit D